MEDPALIAKTRPKLTNPNAKLSDEEWIELTKEEIIWGHMPLMVRCVDCKNGGGFHYFTCKDTSRYEVPAASRIRAEEGIAQIEENCTCWHFSVHKGRRFLGDHLESCPCRKPDGAEEGIGEATIDRSGSGYSIPSGSHHSASFWQGFAMALGSVNRSFDRPTIVKSVMEGYGVTVKLLKDAAVEDYDLKEIRKCMKS